MRRTLVSIAVFGFFFALAAGALAAPKGGYLGVYLAPAEGAPGAVVEEVISGSPAEKAGLKPGDRIVGAGEREVASPEDLRKVVGAASPGDELQLKVVRGEESVGIRVSLGSPPEEAPAPPKGGGGERGFLGVGCAPVHPAVAAHLGLDEGAGVSVGDVWKGSAAEKAGLRTNDIILSVDGKEVRGPEDFIARLSKRAPGEAVKIEAIQGGARKSFEVTLGERPPEAGPARVEPFPRFAWPGAPQPPERPEPPQFGRRGRIILRGPDGAKKLFELPEGSWDFDTFFEEMERQFPELWKIGPEERVKDRLEKLFDTLREGHKGDWSVSSHTASAVVRIVEDGLDITVRDEDGVRTVDVKKGEETIAENLPWEKIDSLPRDIRERVEKAARGIKIDVRGPTPKPIERRAEKEVRA